MIKYIAFLRAINVGGSKIIKMEDLRRIFESMGFAGVSTYIQSGNVMFISKEKNREKLSSFIEKRLKESLGYEIEVMLSTYIELSKVVNENPFYKIVHSENDKLYVAFMASVPAVLPELPFVIEKYGITFFKLINNMIFMVARPVTGVNGLPANFIEKHFNVKVTIRNWNTVNKIVEKYGD